MSKNHGFECDALYQIKALFINKMSGVNLAWELCHHSSMVFCLC